MQSLYAAALVLALTVMWCSAPSEAKIKCYTCTGCGDPLDVTGKNVQAKECAATEFFCYKKIETDKSISRGCATNIVQVCGVTRDDKCLTCSDKELCNSVGHLQAVLGLTALAAILGFVGVRGRL